MNIFGFNLEGTAEWGRDLFDYAGSSEKGEQGYPRSAPLAGVLQILRVRPLPTAPVAHRGCQKLPFGMPFPSILAPWVANLAPWEHPWGPWEQQVGRVGVRNWIFIDFVMILRTYVQRLLAPVLQVLIFWGAFQAIFVYRSVS